MAAVSVVRREPEWQAVRWEGDNLSEVVEMLEGVRSPWMASEAYVKGWLRLIHQWDYEADSDTASRGEWVLASSMGGLLVLSKSEYEEQFEVVVVEVIDD